jgi:hypothetical protein
MNITLMRALAAAARAFAEEIERGLPSDPVAGDAPPAQAQRESGGCQPGKAFCLSASSL